MLELLTGALARRNPAAYAAHFRRLDGHAQLTYLALLREADLAAHARALGLRPTVGFTLALEPEVRLERSVAGKRLPPATGWSEVEAAEAGARALAATLDGPPAVTGLLVAGLGALAAEGSRLRRAGWAVERVVLTVEGAPDGQAEWALFGELRAGGRFWSSRSLLPTSELDTLAPRLEAAANACGGTFVRLER